MTLCPFNEKSRSRWLVAKRGKKEGAARVDILDQHPAEFQRECGKRKSVAQRKSSGVSEQGSRKAQT